MTESYSPCPEEQTGSLCLNIKRPQAPGQPTRDAAVTQSLFSAPCGPTTCPPPSHPVKPPEPQRPAKGPRAPQRSWRGRSVLRPVVGSCRV